jgi:thymidylate synthase (FAD)
MKVEFIDRMGSDLSVVNAARVSFDSASKKLTDRDNKLINYLAEHNHWTPFAHTCLTLMIEAPIYVARQLGKHQVGLVWNEVSRRYVDYKPEIDKPEQWRKRADNKKQGSLETSITAPSIASCILEDVSFMSRKAYDELLALNVCPEQARMVLPQAMLTKWYWTGSLFSFSRVCSLRLKEDTQLETRLVAKEISNICKSKFPVSWKALTGQWEKAA